MRCEAQTLQRNNMKIKILATITASAFLALAASGQGTGRAGGGASTGGSTGAGTSSGAATAPANPGTINPRGAPGINSGVVVGPGNPVPGNVTITPPVNPNTPVAGAGVGANNLNMGSNNITLGTNATGLGSNQFALRTNGLGTNFLTPTGPNNGSRVFSNSFLQGPAQTNVILLRP
jgi:hypothetical protein